MRSTVFSAPVLNTIPKLHSALEDVRAGRSARLEADVLDSHGQRRCMDVIVAPVFGQDNEPTRMMTIWRDITEAKSARLGIEVARNQAEEAVARLAGVLESTMDCVIVVDRSWRVAYMNQNARRLLVLDDAALGRGLWDLYPAEANGSFDAHYRRAFESNTDVYFEEYLSSLQIWLEVHASPTREGLSIFFRDVTPRRMAEHERSQAERQIVHISRHDVLTGLPNRVLFHDTVEQQLVDIGQFKGLAVLTLDLDGFKAVNDAYGHQIGDTLLRQVAERVKHCVGSNSSIARVGADEFAISMTELECAGDEATQMSRRLIEAISDPFSLNGLAVSITCGIGIAIAPEDGVCADQIIKASDVALYVGKANGQGTACRYEKRMDATLQERQGLKISLRQALKNGELEVYYQPLISLKTNRVTACEALVRWRHPTNGLISPSEFIPLAEETGLIMQIGQWVLAEACRQAETWPPDVSIAVNLSPVQFRSDSLVYAVSEVLATAGIDAARLQLEITESVLLNHSEKNLSTLEQLRQLGARIVLDDFGTGYSSLGYLRSFSFDKIKVDRSFISDLPHGKASLAIVRAIAAIGRSLGIIATVEGVESKEQLYSVTMEGYDEAQGYLFSKPLPAIAVGDFIRLRSARTD